MSDQTTGTATNDNPPATPQSVQAPISATPPQSPPQNVPASTPNSNPQELLDALNALPEKLVNAFREALEKARPPAPATPPQEVKATNSSESSDEKQTPGHRKAAANDPRGAFLRWYTDGTTG
jgi:hypothetical protein